MPLKWPVLLAIIILIILSCRIFYPWIEGFFLFYPQSMFVELPEDLGLKYRDVGFHTRDNERLHGWFFPGKEGQPTLLFCHGNAGNISHRLDNIDRLLREGVQVFIFDYRGYGKSTGSPTEERIYEDGLAAHDYLTGQEGIPGRKIVVFGRSLGASVAIEIALRRNVSSVIIESGFTSIREMAGQMGIFRLISPIIPRNYNNREKMSSLGIPKLIIHGDQDEIVPFSMGRSLFEAAHEPKDFYGIKNGGHNDTYIMGGKDYLDRISSFIRETSQIVRGQGNQ